MTERLRVGIVGAGVVASGSHLPVLVNMPDVSVEWICDKSMERARSVARSYKIAGAFQHVSQCPDVDVALVAIPVGLRHEVIPEVLDRGWHAFCEKPFAATLAEHDSYLSAAVRRGLQVGVAQVRRYGRPTVTARRLLQKNFLGPVLRVAAVEGTRLHGTGRGPDWYLADPAAGGGVLMEVGSHLVDQALYVVSAKRISVRACRGRTHLGLELASSLSVSLEAERHGAVDCEFEISMLDDLCNGIFLEFPHHILRVGLGFDDALTLLSREGEELCDLALTEGAATAARAFWLEWRDFLWQCRTGEPGAVAAATTRNSTAILEAGTRRGRAADGADGRADTLGPPVARQ